MSLQVVKTIKELKILAKKAESENEIKKAIGFYKDIIKQDPLDEPAYTRLMVLYRKEKDYEAELAVINKGIKAFETVQARKIHKLTAKNKELVRLSRALLKKAGMKDSNESYLPEPIAGWKKRKEVVEKKIEKNT